MGYRSFTDSEGTEWQAWDVVPRLAERRARDRRLSLSVVPSERRAATDRRQRDGVRAALSHGLSAGWLCFQTALEKRRLTPIPADWLFCALARLEEYLAAAIPAVRITTVELPLLARLDRAV